MRKPTWTSMPNRCQELPRTAPGHPKPTLNRSRDPLRTPRGAQGRSESIPRAFWKPLGAARHAPGHTKPILKMILGPSRDAPWHPRAFGKHSKSVLEASRSVPARPGTAWRVPESGPGCQEECQGAPGNASGPSKSMLSRARGYKKRVFWHGSFAKRCHRDVSSILLRFSVCW